MLMLSTFHMKSVGLYAPDLPCVREGQTADKPKMRRKYLPSPVRERGTAASAVVDEVAKTQ